MTLMLLDDGVCHSVVDFDRLVPDSVSVLPYYLLFEQNWQALHVYHMVVLVCVHFQRPFVVETTHAFLGCRVFFGLHVVLVRLRKVNLLICAQDGSAVA